MALAELNPISETSPLVWHPAYECGHFTIDMQHRGLVSDANAVIAAASGGHSKLLTRRLDELVTHVMSHFRDEEAFLEEHGHVDLAEHRVAHLRLLKEVLTLRHEMLHAPERASELATFVTQSVVLDHIVQEDRSFFLHTRR